MRWLALVMLVACGGNSSGTKSDAKIDSPPDSPPDVAYPADAPLGHAYYIVDHQNVPTTNPQARAYGLDLDNNGTVDNQFGMVLGTLSGMGFDVQGVVTTSVDHGETLMLVDVDTVTPTLTMYDGANPFPPPCNGSADTTCRHHLAGTGIFSLDPASPHDAPLAGTGTTSAFDFGPGHLGIELAFLEPGTPTKMNMVGARAKVTGVSPSGVMTAIVAGAFTQADLNGMVIPQWQVNFTTIVQRDCCGTAASPGGATCNPNGTPACGCVDGSTGKTLLGLFDTSPKDCTITVTEIENNSLIQSLLAPDVTIDGMQALSFGMQVTAVPASIKF